MELSGKSGYLLSKKIKILFNIKSFDSENLSKVNLIFLNLNQNKKSSTNGFKYFD